MEPRTKDALMTMQPKALSRIMVLMAGGIVAAEALFLMTQILPASFEGLGALSTGTIALLLFQMVVLSSIVGAFSLVSLLDKEGGLKKRLETVSILSFAFGLVLSIEGLVAINLNGHIIEGTTPVLMLSIGLGLYSLGILSMVAYVQNEKKLSLWALHMHKAAILFLLLMLPPAILAI